MWRAPLRREDGRREHGRRGHWRRGLRLGDGPGAVRSDADGFHSADSDRFDAHRITVTGGSLRTDRVEKRDFYLVNNVAEYWVVDVDARVVERWRPTQETPELLRDSLVWSPRGGAALVIDRVARFARMDATWKDIREV